jgi:hypothetical protein
MLFVTCFVNNWCELNSTMLTYGPFPAMQRGRSAMLTYGPFPAMQRGRSAMLTYGSFPTMQRRKMEK